MPATLLLLEDDPAIGRTAAYALQREGFEVEHVLLVSEARRSLARQPGRYAAVIVDVGLPDGNGLDLCREWRAAHPALPIVLLTARSEEMDRVLGLELGADDYITKPFSPRELCARVRSLLRRAALLPDAARGSANASGAGAAPDDAGRGFEHDREGCRIAWNGTALALTRMEYGLLALLLGTPGRIWSRAALLDAVWGRDADSTDRTVDTHVKTLRAKLREVCGERELIVTHRGLGYSLDLPGGPSPPASC